MMKPSLAILVAVAAPLATGCGDPVDEDELAVDDASEGTAAKADVAGGTYTFYVVERDLRRCPSPRCGGFFYQLANANQTRCFDGSRAEWCYAPSADWSRTGLDDVAMAKVNAETSLLVRATVGARDWGPFGALAELRVREAWLPQLDNPIDGVLVRVEDRGIRCFTWPCPSLRERKLNSSARADLAELGWDRSGATDHQIADAMEHMQTTGLIIAGDRYRVTGPGGTAKARTVMQYWLEATNEPPAN